MGISQSTAKEHSESGFVHRLLAFQWSTHRGWLYAMLGVLGIILVAPVWSVKYPPLVDFPNHLASAFVLSHLHDKGGSPAVDLKTYTLGRYAAFVSHSRPVGWTPFRTTTTISGLMDLPSAPAK